MPSKKAVNHAAFRKVGHHKSLYLPSNAIPGSEDASGDFSSYQSSLPEQADEFPNGLRCIVCGWKKKEKLPYRDLTVRQIESQRDFRGGDHTVAGQGGSEAFRSQLIGCGELGKRKRDLRTYPSFLKEPDSPVMQIIARIEQNVFQVLKSFKADLRTVVLQMFSRKDICGRQSFCIMFSANRVTGRDGQ